MRRLFSRRYTAARLLAAAPPLLCKTRRYRADSSDALSEEEIEYLDQELPPRELLNELHSPNAAPGDETEEDIKVPGDSFGILRNRVVFYRPVDREKKSGKLGELLGTDTHPLLCVNPETVRLLCGRYGVSVEDAVTAMQMTEGDINAATYALQRRYKLDLSFGSYGLVCLESYAPETFCLVSYNLPSYESTQNDDVLDAIHELTLSAAELPMDTPRRELIDKLVHHWTIDDGTPCGEVLKAMDITVKEVVLLPFGDYSVQGFHIHQPVKEDVPNIGTAAAACCLDLRTGIHNRFRFHVERIADCVSEHVLQEMIHYHQRVHLLRQPYWFKPEYSVEEFIRFKESLLQPSAATFEMRYAACFAPQYGLSAFRNLVEMEKLRIAQHKYEKHYEDFTGPSKWLTSDNAQLQTVVAATGGPVSGGAAMHLETNNPQTAHTAMETRVAPLRDTLAQSMQAHGDRVFSRFYRNNYH